jgi:hypothetical protein
MIWVWRATVEWYWQGKTEELGEKPIPVPHCPPQIPHELTRARTRASAVRGQRLTTWAMARPVHAVSRRSLTAQARIRARVSPCEFMAGKVPLGQVSLRLLLFSPGNITPSWLSIFIYHLGDEALARRWPQFRDIVSPSWHYQWQSKAVPLHVVVLMGGGHEAFTCSWPRH